MFQSPFISMAYSIFLPDKMSVCGVQTFRGRSVFQPKSTLSIEVHRRLFAVLSSVPAGPTVVTGEIPIFFVTGAVAVPHHSLCLIDPCRPCHKVLHRRYRKRRLPGHHGVRRYPAVVGGVHHGEGGAAVVLLRVDVAVTTQGVEGQKRESKHGRARERVLKIVSVADGHAARTAVPAAAAGAAHHAPRRLRLLLLVVMVVVVLVWYRDAPC